MMKRNIFVAGAVCLLSGVAIAKTIDFDTVIKWNSGVISAALEKSGFIASNKAAWDVRVTHQRILDELVKKQSFSLRDATRVCLDKCNMSDFLKNGRGQSGKKCPELCTGFADALVAVNNGFTVNNDTATKQYNINFVSEAFNNSGFAHYDIDALYHDTKMKIRKELDASLRPSFSIDKAVKLCIQISERHFSEYSYVDKKIYIEEPCKKFGDELVKQYNVGASIRREYEGWTIAKIKSAIKPGTKINGAEHTDYYVANNSANLLDIQSCFSPCVFQKSNNQPVCCFDLCGDGVNIFANNQCESTACKTATNPNIFVWEWCGNKNKLYVGDKNISDAAEYPVDFEYELEYKLRTLNELYEIFGG